MNYFHAAVASQKVENLQDPLVPVNLSEVSNGSYLIQVKSDEVVHFCR